MPARGPFPPFHTLHPPPPALSSILPRPLHTHHLPTTHIPHLPTSQDKLNQLKQKHMKGLTASAAAAAAAAGASGAAATSAAREEEVRADNISHYVLRLAYCRTAELRKWFLVQVRRGGLWEVVRACACRGGGGVPAG